MASASECPHLQRLKEAPENISVFSMTISSTLERHLGAADCMMLSKLDSTENLLLKVSYESKILQAWSISASIGYRKYLLR